MPLTIYCSYAGSAKTAAMLETEAVLKTHYALVRADKIPNDQPLAVRALFTNAGESSTVIKLIRNIREQRHRRPLIVFGPGVPLTTRQALHSLGVKEYLEYFQSDRQLTRKLAKLEEQLLHSYKQYKYVVGDLVVRPAKKQATRKRRKLKLRKKEYDLLEYLSANAHKPISHLKLLEEVWGYNYCTVTRTLQTHISSLRKKVDDGYEQKLIHTFPCRGYMLSDQIKSYRT